MAYTTSPSAPLLTPHLERVSAYLHEQVQDLSVYPCFNGLVLFVRDAHHTESAGAVAVINARRPTQQLAFINANIRGHRVELLGTDLGETFRSRVSRLQQSTMHQNHLAYGSYLETGLSTPAVIQASFDKTVAGDMPSEFVLNKSMDGLRERIKPALQQLLQAAARHHSISDALLLEAPTAPNAFIMKWDITGSTSAALNNFPLLREYLNWFGSLVEQLARAAGGKIVAHAGDGQNIVLPLPQAAMHDPELLRTYGNTMVLPLAEQIITTNKQQAGDFHMEIRVVVGLGAVEKTHLGETTSREFFEAAKLLKQQDTRPVRLTPAASAALFS